MDEQELEKNKIFDEMYQYSNKSLRMVTKSYSIPSFDAEDLIQETYLTYLLNYPMNWNEKQKKAMLIKILKNKCIDYFRQQRNDFGLEDVSDMRVYNVSGNPEQKIIEAETIKEFRGKVLALKQEYQEIILLRGLQEKDTKTICVELAISKNTYYSRLFRTKKCLIAICIGQGKIKISVIFL